MLAVNGTKVRHTRESLGFTRRECAARAGVSLSTLKKVERGCFARPRTMRRIVAVLGLDLRLVASPKQEKGRLSLSA